VDFYPRMQRTWLGVLWQVLASCACPVSYAAPPSCHPSHSDTSTAPPLSLPTPKPPSPPPPHTPPPTSRMAVLCASSTSACSTLRMSHWWCGSSAAAQREARAVPSLVAGAGGAGGQGVSELCVGWGAAGDAQGMEQKQA
jgi:hypothetical protein